MATLYFLLWLFTLALLLSGFLIDQAVTGGLSRTRVLLMMRKCTSQRDDDFGQFRAEFGCDDRHVGAGGRRALRVVTDPPPTGGQG